MFYGGSEWFNLTKLVGYDFENEIQNLILMSKEDWILKHFTVVFNIKKGNSYFGFYRKFILELKCRWKIKKTNFCNNILIPH